MNHPALAEDDGRIRVSVPETIQGDVMGQVNRLGGLITSVDCEPGARITFGATMPGERLVEFRNWLHRSSNGQGAVTEESS
ncbi:MAG: hypothetical protein ABMA26_10405 [Limisphaerales bacterium]